MKQSAKGRHMTNPQLDIDTTAQLKDGDMAINLVCQPDAIYGHVGPWDTNRWEDNEGAERGGFYFGLDCDISIRTGWRSGDDNIDATVQVSGIMPHGSDVSRKRILGYEIATTLIEVAEKMKGKTYDEIADAVMDAAQEANVSGARLLDGRNLWKEQASA